MKKILFIVLLGIVLITAGISNAATPPFLPFDNTGDLFVTDSNDSMNGVILRITPAGAVSVVVTAAEIMAATGAAGARFTDNGIAVDASGNMFFTDSESDTILRRTVGGTVSVLTSNAQIMAATGGGSAWPEGIAFGSDGFLYVTENATDSILQVNPATGAVSVYVGEATFNALPGITDVSIDASIVGTEGGIIYAVSDDGDAAPNAIFEIILGAPPTVSVLASEPPFSDLDVFMTRAPNGDLIISDDAGGDTIYRVTPAGTVSVFLSETQLEAAGCANGDVDLEGGIAFDDAGNFYLAEENSDTIYRFDGALNCSVWVTAANIQAVTGIAPDLDGGIAFVSDAVNVSAVPTMTEWGMIVFMIFAGSGSVLYLRRKRRV